MSSTPTFLPSDSAADGSPFTVQAQLEHMKWAQYTCPFGWAVQGAWPPVAQEGTTTLTALHRYFTELREPDNGHT